MNITSYFIPQTWHLLCLTLPFAFVGVSKFDCLGKSKETNSINGQPKLMTFASQKAILERQKWQASFDLGNSDPQLILWKKNHKSKKLYPPGTQLHKSWVVAAKPVEIGNKEYTIYLSHQNQQEITCCLMSPIKLEIVYIVSNHKVNVKKSNKEKTPRNKSGLAQIKKVSYKRQVPTGKTRQLVVFLQRKLDVVNNEMIIDTFYTSDFRFVSFAT